MRLPFSPLLTTLTVEPDFTVLSAGLNRRSTLSHAPGFTLVPPTMRISFFGMAAPAVVATPTADRPRAAVAVRATEIRRVIAGVLPSFGATRFGAGSTSERESRRASARHIVRADYLRPIPEDEVSIGTPRFAGPLSVSAKTHVAARRLAHRPAQASRGVHAQRTLTEFKEDKLNHWAAALTFYAVLSLFPALLVMVSLVGLLAEPAAVTEFLTDVIWALGPASAVETFKEPIESITGNRGAAGIMAIAGSPPRCGRRRDT